MTIYGRDSQFTPPSQHSGPWAFPWNAPKTAINLEQEVELLPTQLQQWITEYNKRAVQHREQLDAEVNLKYFNTEERDPYFRHYRQETVLSLVSMQKEKQRCDPDLAILADLNEQPKFISQPLQQKINYLRTECSKARAHAFLINVVEPSLKRLEAVRDKQMTIPYRIMAGRSGLDLLLHLPELHQNEVRDLSVKVAAHIEMIFAQTAESVMTDNTSLEEMLRIYRVVAKEASKLSVSPAHYNVLGVRGAQSRRKEINYDLIPGALARLCCANWWYRKMWRLRCQWREEQLRAVCMVHRYASVYVSNDAIVYKREQIRKAKEFFKAHNLVNDDGLQLDMESVVEASTSNLKNRRNEAMACIRGMQNLGEMRKDCAVFFTITCPSKYHSTLRSGLPNPNWNTATPRESSDYLVNLFAGIRKKMNRHSLRWYGIRIVEPHHDGTAHWHLLCWMRKKDRRQITKIVREFAIKEEREELGADVKARFKADVIDRRKGDPVSYVAKYIAKNIDGGHLRNLKSNIGQETGKQLRDTVENVATWAGLHRVQQFRFFGIPSRQAYRELRLLASRQSRKNKDGRSNSSQVLVDKRMDDVMAAADAGCFATYIMKQGGVLIPRKYHVVRAAYETTKQANDYGEYGVRIYGIWSPLLGEGSRICTHPDNWVMVRKSKTAVDNAVRITGGNAAPWTRGNNCRIKQKLNISASKQLSPAREELRLLSAIKPSALSEYQDLRQQLITLLMRRGIEPHDRYLTALLKGWSVCFSRDLTIKLVNGSLIDNPPSKELNSC